MSETKLCCNCLHCARWRRKDGIETHCDLTDKYLGYLQVMEENTDCKHWEKETKWDLQREHDKQIRAEAIENYIAEQEKFWKENKKVCNTLAKSAKKNGMINMSFFHDGQVSAFDQIIRRLKEQKHKLKEQKY